MVLYDDTITILGGKKAVSLESIKSLREADGKRRDRTKIIAQAGGQERMLSCKANILICGGSRGGSKPLMVTQRVVTPFGYRAIGTLRSGDVISGVDGHPQRVLYNTNKGKLPCYRLYLEDGSEVVSSHDHAWNVRRSGCVCDKDTWGYTSGKWNVWTTDMIVDHLKEMEEEGTPSCLEIPICDPVMFMLPREDADIEPHELGRILGRGGVSGDHANPIVKCCSDMGLDLGSPTSLFIPRGYLYDNIGSRRSLLNGLIESGGNADSGGYFITTCSCRLANDIKFLVGSLGGLATICRRTTEVKASHDSYMIRIRLYERSGRERVGRKIVGYEYVGERECCCIRVSNPDSLFMVEDFVVTHNTYSLLMEALKDISNPDFRAVIMRHELDDLSDIVETSNELYDSFGQYNKSKNDMTWNFNRGGFLKFSYHADSVDDFKKRFQGRQFSYVGVDEITHMDYAKFKYMITCNRNAFGIRNRFIGTCNPDPDSWVAQFIDWWIGEDGFPIPERDGVVRYCFMDGEDPSSIYWGDTREEVYDQCHDIIDRYWKDEYSVYGSPQQLFIKSVCFVEAKLSDNKQLMRSDPSYLANLANQSEEQRARDLDGNWKFRSVGDDIIKLQHMEDFYNNPQMIGDNVRRASCDVAFEGGDFLVMWLWIGMHIQDVFIARMDSKASVEAVGAKLGEWHVREENFTYDLNGLGQAFKGYFPKALPFNNREAVAPEFKFIYANLKSQAAYMFAKALTGREISINPDLINMRVTTRHANDIPLRQVLNKERKAIRKSLNDEDKGWSLIRKTEMKSIVGHSPDFIEAMFMRFIFQIKKRKHTKPRGLLRYVGSPYL